MKSIFADTFYFLALLNPIDQHHEKTVRLAGGLKAKFVTTEWVLIEVADAVAGKRSRSQFFPFLWRLERSLFWEIISSENLFKKSLVFYDQHRDKDWTLTDCASFVVMREHEITDALTGDRHFEQAGFTALLK